MYSMCISHGILPYTMYAYLYAVNVQKGTSGFQVDLPLSLNDSFGLIFSAFLPPPPCLG